MHLKQISINGEDFIGLMGMSTDNYAIISPKFPDINVLRVPILKTMLYGTNLVGLFCVGNSNGLILPYFISKNKIALIKRFLSENGIDIEIGTLKSKYTAVGNMIACNNNAAIVSPKIRSIRIIEDILDVEVIRSTIGEHDEVGACCVVTNKGFVSHPDARDEIEKLSEIFNVNGSIGSVNFGFPFVKSGLIANSNGYLVGSRTTGIEIGRIDEALGFLD